MGISDEQVLAQCRAEDWAFDLGTEEFRKRRMADKRRELTEAMTINTGDGNGR